MKRTKVEKVILDFSPETETRDEVALVNFHQAHRPVEHNPRPALCGAYS